MACPYFYPVEPYEGEPWIRAPRLPLGDAYRGTCQAGGHGAAEPDESTQRSLCNVGYCRGVCPNFPAAADADAIRFSIAPADAQGVLLCIIEKDYAPLRHSRFEYCNGSAEGDFPNDRIRRQASAFAYSYERRRTRA